MEPTERDLADPMFEAIWQAIKGWDIGREHGFEAGRGPLYAGATGTDVMAILTAVRAARPRWGVEARGTQAAEQAGSEA